MASEQIKNGNDEKCGICLPPRGAAMLMVIGPGLVWCGEYIGSGEVVLATRAGAILGVMVLWVPTISVFTKFWIGLAGAHYTVCTGEGMVDMMGRTPGPRNWVIWPVFIGQLVTGAFATGSIAITAGYFLHHFLPFLPEKLLGWAISLMAISLVWSGRFDVLKKAMSVLVVVIIVGVFEIARTTWPGWGPMLTGMFGFQVPEIPAWAREIEGVADTPWAEILPLLGWAAGGFGSQVWYTYWVIGAGYGMARGRSWGEALDPDMLRAVSVDDAHRLKGWCRMVIVDASFAMVVGIVVTAAFLMAGAGILGPAEIAPAGASVATELSQIFGEGWGAWGAKLFMLAGLAALISTLLGQFAGWPRLLCDCARLLVPAVSRYPWKTQFRFVLVLYAISNLVVVYSFGVKPVILVQISAVLGGLILTPLQALSVGITLFVVMPRFFKPEVARILRPHPVYAGGLLLAFIVFSYFCIYPVLSML